jgi:hypothetical protein
MVFTKCAFFFYRDEVVTVKLTELNVKLTELRDQLAKAKDEIVGKIAALETSLIDVSIPEEARVALAVLAEQAQALDDIVPDTIPEPPVEEPPIV